MSSRDTSSVVDIDFDSHAEMIRFQIDLNQTIYLTGQEKTKWLAPREKDFAVATIICAWAGHNNPNSDQSKAIYGKYFKKNISSSEIHVYLGKLSDKNFLTYDKNDQRIELPGFWDEPFDSIRWVIRTKTNSGAYSGT